MKKDDMMKLMQHKGPVRFVVNGRIPRRMLLDAFMVMVQLAGPNVRAMIADATPKRLKGNFCEALHGDHPTNPDE